MSANFKKLWYVSCVKCAKQAQLIDGDSRMPEVREILEIYGWTFPIGGPRCKRHSLKPEAKPKEVER